MATFVKVYSFPKALGDKIHNLGTDQLVVALSNTAPNLAHTQLSDLTQISYTNCSSRNITTTSFNQSSGTAKLILADLTLTASGTVGPFEWVWIYNDTATNDELIGYYAFPTGAVTLASGETLVIDFDASNGALTVGP